MSVLFAKRRKVARQSSSSEKSTCVTDESIEKSSSSGVEVMKKGIEMSTDDESDAVHISTMFTTFEQLGIGAWLASKCGSLRITRPTPVQVQCIPKIVEGRDVVGCAQTGSGKTAAFALPILHELSKDPYGPFALVLTPTRELAFQIADQFQAFGGSIGLRDCVIVGGVDTLEQSIKLQSCPHVIIATPGRLRDHLIRTNPIDLSKLRFVVFDEADRLLESSFYSDLRYIMDRVNPNRQMLLFSATMTPTIDSTDLFTLNNPFRFDATPTATTVDTLQQNYAFIPFQSKTCYLVYVVTTFLNLQAKTKKLREDDSDIVDSNDTATSGIIFVATCKQCQLLAEILLELEVPCVVLHSLMSQKRRLAALGKFKVGVSRLLICTDVASRGLDIPSVELVINYDVPHKYSDYVHRVGRTARAGRKGRAISLVSQYDIELLQNIEGGLDKQMEELKEVKEEDVLKLLNNVTMATRVAKMKLSEYGFDEKVKHKKEKQARSNKRNVKDQ